MGTVTSGMPLSDDEDAASAIKDLKEAGVADFRLKAGVMVAKNDRGETRTALCSEHRSEPPQGR
jgi:hypothetical protein